MTRLRELLIKYEGIRLKAYQCTAGKWTIGVGRNLEDTGISELEARFMLTNDIERIQKEAVEHFPWFKSINVVRQDVVLLMIFQLGLEGFKGFRKAIQAIQYGNFDKAADEMLDSDWAKQTPERAKEAALMMRTGRYV